MLDEHVELLERALVEQHVDPLARGELALRVLGRDPLRPAARQRRAPPPLEFFQDVAHVSSLTYRAPGLASGLTNQPAGFGPDKGELPPIA